MPGRQRTTAKKAKAAKKGKTVKTAKKAPAARTRTRAKKSTKAKKAMKKAAPARVALATAPAKTRAALADDIRRVLAAHGIDGKLAQLHVTAPAPATVTATAAPGVVPCPPGSVRRVVCEFRNGRFICAERCVPI